MEYVQIRKMEKEDVKEVSRIEQQIFSNPWSQKSFLDAVSSTDNCYLTAVYRDTIVGYCGLWCSFESADLCNLAVSAEYRRHHFGSMLLERGLSEAGAAGVQRVMLEVRQSNTPAIALYRRLGFQEIGSRPNYYSDPQEDGLLMEKQLSGLAES